MVVPGMGMLDDAIREHLELKRRRGADPGEVDREQAEALAPVSDRELDAEDGPDVDDELDVPLAPETGTPVIGGVGAESGEELPETAELDMERALQGDGESEPDAVAEPHDEHGSSAWHEADAFELSSAEEMAVEHRPAREGTEAPVEHMRTGLPNEQSDPRSR
jgi:hypothetical protein